MKNFSFVAGRLLLISAALLLCCAGTARAEDAIHGQALLIWATDTAQSPNPKHIPVDPDLARKLSRSPYRWKYYFEVRRQDLNIPVGEVKTNIVMSKHCVLDVRNPGGNRVEVKLYGEGKPVSKTNEKFVEDWPLIFAGSARNDTAWLVVLRRTKTTVASK
jgi:hypothetical protein